MIVMLDSGPLGLVTNPRGGKESQDCKDWLFALPDIGHLALVPEIIDYEHRRELLLANLTQAIARLDGFKSLGAYLPVNAEWQQPLGTPVIIATTNIGHLSRFAAARLWRDIP